MSIRYTITAALLGAAIAVNAAAPLRWLDTVHDFGAFEEATGPVECTFAAVNGSKDPIGIMRVSTTCGCTASSVSTKTVEPGDTLIVTATYDPANRPGMFEKRVVVETSDGAKQNLYLTGTVVGDNPQLKHSYQYDLNGYRLKEQRLDYGIITINTVFDATVTGFNYSTDSLTLSFEPGNAISAKPVDAVAPGKPFALSYSFDASKLGGYGLQTDTLRLISSLHPEQTMPLPVAAIVVDDFSNWTEEQIENAGMLTPENYTLDLGRIDTLSTKPVQAEITFTNTGKAPVTVHRIYTIDNALTFKGIKDGTTLAPGKSRKLTVTIDPALLRGRQLLDARLTVMSNTPGGSMLPIRVMSRLGDH